MLKYGSTGAHDKAAIFSYLAIGRGLDLREVRRS